MNDLFSDEEESFENSFLPPFASPRGGNFLPPSSPSLREGFVLSGRLAAVCPSVLGGAFLTISRRLVGVCFTTSTRGRSFTSSFGSSAFSGSILSTVSGSGLLAFLTTKAFGFLTSFTEPAAIKSFRRFTCSIVTVLE